MTNGNGPRLDDETIAALLDGRVDERRRAEAAAALATDEEGRYVMAEAATWLRSEQRTGSVLAWPRLATGTTGLLIAAALVVLAVVVAGPGSRLIKGAASPTAPFEALRQAAGGTPLTLPQAPSPRALFGAEGAQQLAARAAVAVADISALASAGETDPAAAGTLRQIGERLELDAATDGWLASLDAAATPSPAPRRVLDDLADSTDRQVFDAALWLEVFRIAAHNQLSGFFGGPKLDAGRRSIAAIDWGPLGDTASRLGELSRSSDLEVDDLVAIEHASAELLARLRTAPVP